MQASGHTFASGAREADCSMRGPSVRGGTLSGGTSLLCFQLGFQLGNPGFEWGNGFLDLGRGVARRDVFRAVPIERHDLDEKYALDDAARFRFGELRDEIRVLAGVGHAGMTEDLQPGALWIIPS